METDETIIRYHDGKEAPLSQVDKVCSFLGAVAASQGIEAAQAMARNASESAADLEETSTNELEADDDFLDLLGLGDEKTEEPIKIDKQVDEIVNAEIIQEISDVSPKRETTAKNNVPNTEPVVEPTELSAVSDRRENAHSHKQIQTENSAKASQPQVSISSVSSAVKQAPNKVAGVKKIVEQKISNSKEEPAPKKIQSPAKNTNRSKKDSIDTAPKQLIQKQKEKIAKIDKQVDEKKKETAPKLTKKKFLEATSEQAAPLQKTKPSPIDASPALADLKQDKPRQGKAKSAKQAGKKNTNPRKSAKPKTRQQSPWVEKVLTQPPAKTSNHNNPEIFTQKQSSLESQAVIVDSLLTSVDQSSEPDEAVIRAPAEEVRQPTEKTSQSRLEPASDDQPSLLDKQFDDEVLPPEQLQDILDNAKDRSLQATFAQLVASLEQPLSNIDEEIELQTPQKKQVNLPAVARQAAQLSADITRLRTSTDAEVIARLTPQVIDKLLTFITTLGYDNPKHVLHQFLQTKDLASLLACLENVASLENNTTSIELRRLKKKTKPPQAITQQLVYFGKKVVGIAYQQFQPQKSLTG